MTIRDSGWEAERAIDERPACPRCGTASPTELHYGLVAASLDDYAAWERLGILFAGCIDEGTKWMCRVCEFEWGEATL